MSKIIGIDISKQTFDVCFKKENENLHKVFSNNVYGFELLIKNITKDDLVVMEASGPYYVLLASFLHEHSIKVSVVNPLRIKRYSQMQFYRAKTDKKDTQTIMEYGYLQRQDLLMWQPESKAVHSLKQLRTTLELLQKQHPQTLLSWKLSTQQGLWML